MTAKRKIWQKPTLIVLVRGEPAEAVLLACKYTSGGTQTSRTINRRCYNNFCQTCSFYWRT